MYDVYRSVRDMSWQCLFENGVRELPVRPVAAAKRYGIVCKELPQKVLRGASGRILNESEQWYILVNIDDTPQRKRYTIAHELGHYLLGHLDGTSATQEREYAAERFAADLLMPACVLWGLDVHTPEEIAQLCNVSVQAASIRAERMEVLYKRNKFLLHPLERKVYAQFGDFIQKYRR